jgi:hypothetical protein
MWRFVKSWFKAITITDKERINAYLAESVSLADLERRQRELQTRGFKA